MTGAETYARRVNAALAAATESEARALAGVGKQQWALLNDSQQQLVQMCLNWCRHRGGPGDILTLAEVRAVYSNRRTFIDGLPGDWPQRLHAIHIAAGKRLAGK